MTDTATEVPKDLVLVGRIGLPFGVKGWLHIHPYSSQADALLSSAHWWLTTDETHWRAIRVKDAKPHGGTGVVVQLSGVDTREQAEALRNVGIGIARSEFPPADEDEYYWVDLIGLAVENTAGVPLGTVTDLMDNGAHSILQVEVAGPASEAVEEGKKAKKPPQELIPFVARHVLKVDLAAKKIVVDWEL